MFALVLTPPYLPFAIAFVVMAGIGLIEAVGLGLGHLGLDGPDGHDGGLLDWLGLGGELPMLIWLTALLGCFSLTGLALQQVVTATGGKPLGWAGASAVALVVGLLLNSVAARGLARVMPGFESSVVSTDDLAGRRGTILEGQGRRGRPARAKVVDAHGQAHLVMVEPHDDADTLPAGARVLLVRRAGPVFFAVSDGPLHSI